MNLFSCRQFDISSDLLFSKLSSSGKVMMAIFSSMHNVHLFVMFVYAGALVLIDQVISGAWLLSFNFHVCFDNVVLLMHFRLLNDNLCVYLLCFHVPSVSPIYVLFRICGCLDFGLVNNAGCLAVSVEWAFDLFTTVVAFG